MIEILTAADHVVALRGSGRIDEADVARGIEAVEAALARHEHVALYAEMELAGMTPGAFAKDFRYGLSKLRELRRFPRAAVVTSQEWVRWTARVTGAVLPQIEIRVFSPAERDEALAWVSQPLAAPQVEPAPMEPSVRTISTTSPSVIGFEVNGRIRREDMRRLIAASEEVMQAHERVRVLVRILKFEGVSLDALREEGLASMKMKGWRQVERYALVGGPPWMATILSWSAPLVPLQTRHFDLEHEGEAWEWIGAQAKPEAA